MRSAFCLAPFNRTAVAVFAAAAIAGVFAQLGSVRAELLVAPDGQSRFDLDGNHTLIVRNPEPGKITAEVYRRGYFHSGLMFGNALFDSDDLRWVRLCPDCEEVIFLQMHDQSSTYGAIAGVVVWVDWPVGSLTVLPLMRPYVTAPDVDGVSRLLDNVLDSRGNSLQVEYRFVNGRVERLLP